jgi:serine/threonine-protein kinase HipA
MAKEILVYADWKGLPTAEQVGTLHAETLRGKEIFSFSYAENWLSKQDKLFLDPELLPYSGRQYLHSEKPNYGIFLDSAPDR